MPPFEDITIMTARLNLRCLTEADVSDLFQIFSHRAVMRYWSCSPFTKREQAVDLLKNITEGYHTGQSLQLGLECLENGRLIGTCTLHEFHQQCRRAEIGYALGRPFWGQGFMHEALTAFIAHAFNAMDLFRLEADVDPRNLASTRTLERLGFQKEGHLRERWIVDGEVSDSWLYGLLRRDWSGDPIDRDRA